MPGVLALWPTGPARLGGRVLAVGLRPAHHVVAPADLVLVEQVGQVGPGVDGLARPRVLVAVLGVAATVLGTRLAAVDRRRVLRALGGPGLQGVHAARGVVGLGAVGGPLRHQEEVGRQAPRGVRLEHVVLQDEVLRVGPVVGDVALRVVAHHVGRRRVGAGRVGGHQATLAAGLGLRDEAVHLPPVDVCRGVRCRVGSAAVHVGVVGVGRDALPRLGVVHADRGHAVLHRDPVGAGVGPEVGVEGPVLLLDHDDVLDLVDARRDDVAAGGAAADTLDGGRGGRAAARRGKDGKGGCTEADGPAHGGQCVGPMLSNCEVGA